MKIKRTLLLSVLFFMTVPMICYSQFTVRRTPGGTGYLEYLPPDYSSNPTKKYPLMVFLHGAGEKGTGSEADLERVKRNGPPKHIRDGHNMCFNVNGVEKCFIVISPQLPGGKPSWGVSLIDEVFSYILNGPLNYRVDLNQIHLTGLSLGSNGVYKYAYMTSNDPNKLASISPVAAWGDTNKGCIISERKIPLWAFHGDQDKTVGYAGGLAMFNAVKDCTTPVPTADLRFTTYEGVAHNSWGRAYSTDHSVQSPINLYEWMLMQSLSGVPTANAGPDQTITLPTNTATLSGSGSTTEGTITSYRWTKVGGGNATLTNANSPTLTVNNLAVGIYTFRLTVTDAAGNTAFDEARVTVNPEVVNSPPVANAGADITITLPINSTNINGIGIDTDGSISSYNWTQRSGPSTATLSGATNPTLSARNLVEGTYLFRLTVVDNDGASAFDEVNVIVKPAVVNSPPIANAGPDITVNLPTNTATLNGSGSDSDGTIVSYAWTKISGPAVTLTNADRPALSLSALVAGSYTFRLTVTDDAGDRDSDDVNVIVVASNQSPTANAGSDISITLPTNATNIVGRGNDPDGTIVSYLWVQIGGPTTATLTNSNTATVSVSNMVQGTYKFQLTVTDDDGAQASDIVNVIVAAAPVNEPPVANAGPDLNIGLPVNSVELNGSGTDSDGNIVQYRWEKRSGPSSFILAGQTTPTVTVNNLVAGTYIFRLTVTDDDGATDYDEVTVVVSPETVNQAPSANAGPDKNITLPINTVTFNGSGTDSDGTIASYQWTQRSGPSTATLSGANSASLTASNLVVGTYVFRLIVVDNEGASDSDNVTVVVSASNMPPVVYAGSDINIVLPTNSVDIVGTASDSDGSIASTAWTQVGGTAASFTTSGTTISLTNLVAGTYVFRFSATDNDGATAQDDVEVIVTASNILPIVNAGADKTITLPTNSINITGRASDSDGTIVSYNWAKVSGPSASLTNANRATVTITNMVEGVYVFSFTATDNDGGSRSDQVRVTVLPEATNQTPIAEAGTNVVITLPTNIVTIHGSGTDPDGTISSYLWTKKSGPSSLNMVNATTASLTAESLVEGTYIFTLTVTDDDGATDSDEVTVTVNPSNVNQSPLAKAGSDITLILPTNSTNIVGAGSDADGTIVSYLWSQVSGPSAATIVGASNATVSISNLVEGTYTFNLNVTDDDNASDDDYVNVYVISSSVNQNPVANAGLDKTIILPTNSVNLNGIASDLDGTVTSYAWSKISGPDAIINNRTNSVATVTNMVEGIYVFRLTVTDDDGATGFDDVMVNVLSSDINQSPVAYAGEDVNIVLPTNAIELKGTGTDADGTVEVYRWTQVSGPTANLVNSKSPIATASDMIEGVYVFRLTVTDEDGASGSDDIKVTVLPVNTNLAPTANAGEDRAIKLPTNNTTLFGSGFDSDGTITAYQWDKLSGPTVTTSDMTSATLELTNLIEGTYIFRLMVTDDDGATGADEVEIKILSPSFNLNPVADAGEDQFIELPINSTTLIGSGQDPDGIIDSYVWNLVSGPNTPDYTDLSVKDLDISNLIEGVYIFSLEVTDDGDLADSDEVKVVVSAPDATELQAPIVDAGEDKIIFLPETSTMLIGKMTSAGLVSSFAWSQIAGANVQLSGIDSDTLYVSGLTEGDYTFELEITDNLGLTGRDRVNIEVISQLSDLKYPMEMFSPNGDGENDYWILDPEASKYEGCDLYIYNRRGSQVYQTNSYQNNWEAILNGEQLPDGVYFYILKCGNEKSASGSITVIR